MLMCTLKHRAQRVRRFTPFGQLSCVLRTQGVNTDGLQAALAAALASVGGPFPAKLGIIAMTRHLIASVLALFFALSASISSAASTLPAIDRLKSCEPRVAVQAANEILNSPDIFKEPLQIFSPAYILFQNGKKDEAVFWFYAAQLRVRYQLAFEKGDRGQLLSIMLMTVGPPINNHAFQDVARLDRILDQVLVWDKSSPNPFREKARSPEAETNLEKIYSGMRDLKAKLGAEKAELEQKAKAAAPQIELMVTQSRTQPCRPGEIDPAQANQTIEREWLQVMDFVRRSADVARLVGTIKGVGRESSTMKSGEVVPSRYIVSVSADKPGYAVVNVSRTSGNAEFSLACVTHISMGQRDPFKDVCSQ